jgi:hypothetical protein
METKEKSASFGPFVGSEGFMGGFQKLDVFHGQR